MGCYDCNSPPVATLDNMRNYLNKLIEQGEILSDLRDCQGGKLPPGTKVALCENLEAKIKELVGDSVVNLVNYNQDTGVLEVVSNKGTIKQQFNLKELVLGTLPKFGNGLKVTYKDNAISEVAVDTGNLPGALSPGNGIDIKDGVISVNPSVIPRPTPPKGYTGVGPINVNNTKNEISLDTSQLPRGTVYTGNDPIVVKDGVISLKEDAIPKAITAKDLAGEGLLEVGGKLKVNITAPTPPTVEKGVTFTNLLGNKDYGSLLK